MKNKLHLWYYVLALSIFSFASLSCSDDKNDKIQLPAFSENLEKNEIRIIFSPTSEKSEFIFDINNSNYKGEFLINWGEDNILRPTPQGTISHIFTEVDKDYLITIRAKEEQSIEKFKISEAATSTRIKSIRLGECPDLMEFSIHILDNILERFDLSKNPQFHNNYTFLYINKPNFNFDDFTEFKEINFDISIPMSVQIENMNANYLRIFYTLTALGKVQDIKIKNSEIERLDIMSYNKLDITSHLDVDNIDLEGSSIDYLEFQQIKAINDLDLNRTKYCKKLVAYNLDCLKKIHFSDTHEVIQLNPVISLPKTYAYIEEIDLRNCKDLTHLIIQGYENLLSILYNKTDKLQFVRFKANTHIENYEFEKTADNTKSLKNDDIKTQDSTIHTLSLRAN